MNGFCRGQTNSNKKLISLPYCYVDAIYSFVPACHIRADEVHHSMRMKKDIA